MREYQSSIVFEIVNGTFVYRGWDVCGDHMHKEVKPQHVVFGKSGIELKLVDGMPKLEIPSGQKVELVQSDYAFSDGKRVDGKFVEVKIY